MKCPVCKNKYGFVCSTCCKCGYNYSKNKYHTIEVDADVLERIVPPNIFYYFVVQHEKNKRNLYKDIYD